MLLVEYDVICRILIVLHISDVSSFDKLFVECDAMNDDFKCTQRRVCYVFVENLEHSTS